MTQCSCSLHVRISCVLCYSALRLCCLPTLNATDSDSAVYSAAQRFTTSISSMSACARAFVLNYRHAMLLRAHAHSAAGRATRARVTVHLLKTPAAVWCDAVTHFICVYKTTCGETQPITARQRRFVRQARAAGVLRCTRALKTQRAFVALTTCTGGRRRTLRSARAVRRRAAAGVARI